MKKKVIALLLFLILLSSVLSVSAEVSSTMVDVVSKNLDNFFPLRALEELYTTPSQPVYSNIGPDTAIESSVRNGTRNIILYANADGVNAYSVLEQINTGNMKNFYLSVDVMPNDIYPQGSGGCFLAYVNNFIAGLSQEEEVLTVSLVLGDKVYLDIYNETTGEVSREVLSEVDTSKGYANLTLLRLTGETLFYIDGKYAGQFHDGKVGPFQLRYGSRVFENGEIADCSFDNLLVRKVTQ